MRTICSLVPLHMIWRNIMKHSRFLAKSASVFLSAALTAVSIPAAQLPSASAADSNYGEALAMSLYFFDANACGTGITDGPLTWRGDCHTYDGQAEIGSLSGAAKAVVDPDGDGKVDVSGGFHDAGDHIKFNLTIGFAMNGLSLSEYLNPGVYEQCGCRDHLEYVLRRGCDYLMKTTYLDASGEVAAVAGTVGDGGVDHGLFAPPEEQTYKREIYWLTAEKNNSAVCSEMAAGLAGTAYVMKDSDPGYSAKCIKYAKALRQFAADHVGNNCDGLGYYPTSDNYQDEQAMCDTWLWLLGEGSGSSCKLTGNGAYDGGLYDCWKFTWDKTWQGYAAMMYTKTKDEVWANELEFELNNASGLSDSAYNNKTGWGNSRYNCALQMDALVLARGDKESSFAKAAKFQMDYILGNNSYGYSFLIGYGSKWPTHIHHRAAAHLAEGQSLAKNPEVKYTAYGTLIGGPDEAGYEDHSDKYQYTEPALDYNACFAIACAGLYSLYGGDASALKPIAESAEEINSAFRFSSGESTEPVTTTTTTGTTSGQGKTLRGDVNIDTLVDVKDAVLLARYVGNDNVTVTEAGLANAELDGENGISTGDLTYLLMLIAGLVK